MATSSATTFADAYDAAADHYDHPANSYWDRFSRRTLEHVAPAPGDRVLDAGCGTGAFAIPAAEAVGPAGYVLGLDLAANLLTLATNKARARGLTNVSFEQRDFLSPGVPCDFDRVVAVFSLFFAEDLRDAAARLWRLVAPGGALVITTWGAALWEPASSMFWQSTTACRPDLRRPHSPWERLSDPSALRVLLDTLGAEHVHVVAERGDHPLTSADDWWRMVLGSGFRATVERLSPLERDRIRHDNIDRVRAAGLSAVRADTVYGVARKRRT